MIHNRCMYLILNSGKLKILLAQNYNDKYLINCCKLCVLDKCCIHDIDAYIKEEGGGWGKQRGKYILYISI